MPTLSAAIKLTEDMSGPLRSIMNAMNGVTDAMDKMQSKSGKGLDSSSIAAMKRELNNAGAAMQQFDDHIDDVRRKTEQAAAAQKKLAEQAQKVGAVGQSIEKVGSAIAKVGTAAMAATTALAGMTLVKGYNRLVEIDTAKSKLAALGNTASDVTDIMKSANTAVKGTSYGLNEAATTAAAAVAAGVKPGQDLTKYLSLTSDAAAVASSSMSDMGSIFNKVQTAQRAYMDDINQLADRGIPIYQWLATEAGTTADAVRDMASNGQISSEMFLSAVEKNIGGAAKIMGETSFSATLANIGASLSRIGANFLDAGGTGGGFFSQMKPLLVDFNKWLGNAETKAADMGVKFGASFAGIVEHLKQMDPGKLEALAKAMGAIALAGPVLLPVGKGIEGIGKSIDALSQAQDKIGPLLENLGKLQKIGGKFSGKAFDGVRNLGDAIGDGAKSIKGSSITQSIIQGVGGALKSASEPVRKMASGFGDAFGAIADGAKNIKWSSITQSIVQEVGGALKSASEPVRKMATDVFGGFGDALDAVFGGMLKSASEPVKKMAADIFGGFGDAFGGMFEGVGGLIGKVFEKIGPISIPGLSGISQIGGLFAGALPGIGLFIAGITAVIGVLGLLNRDGQAASFVTNLANNVATQAPLFAQKAVTMIQGFTQSFIQNLPQIVQRGVELVTALINGLITALPAIILAAGQIIIALAVGLIQALPTIITCGFQAVSGLIDGIINALPNLITQGITLLFELAQAIIDNLPEIITAGIQIIVALITGLAQAIPKIIEALPRIVSAVWDGLSAVDWAGLGFQILCGIGNGLMRVGEALGNTVSQVSGSIVQFFKDNFQIHSPSVVMEQEIGVKLLPGVDKGVLKTLPASRQTMTMAVKSITDAPNTVNTANTGPNIPVAQGDGTKVSAAGPMASFQTPKTDDIAKAYDDIAQTAQTGMVIIGQDVNKQQDVNSLQFTTDTQLMVNQTKGIYNSLPGPINSTMQVIEQNNKDAFNRMLIYMGTMPPAFQSEGVALMNGLNDGIASQIPNVLATTGSLVEQLKATFITGLGIHSPARFTEYVGNMSIAGLIKGLSPQQLMVFIRSIVDQMKSSFAGGAMDLNGLVDYLYNDTPKLIEWLNTYDDGGVINTAAKAAGVNTGAISTSNNGLEGALSIFEGLLDDDSHGYSQSNRWGSDFDCSSSIIWSLQQAGLATNGASWTGNMSDSLSSAGWERLGVPAGAPAGLERGDIVLNDAYHVAWWLGNTLGAFHDDYDGAPEDSSGMESNRTGWYDHPWNAILRYTGYRGVYTGPAMAGTQTKLADAIQQVYNQRVLGLYGMWSGNGDLASWLTEALNLTGQPLSLLQGLMYAAMKESGGNPNLENDWDNNAAKGTPSIGLLQTIQPTFDAYKLPGHDNIRNPVDNAIAAIRYMIAKYGSVADVIIPRMGGWYGYSVGSRYIPEDMLAMVHAGEAIIPASEMAAIQKLSNPSNPYANSGGEVLPMTALAPILSASGEGGSGFGLSGMTANRGSRTQTVNYGDTRIEITVHHDGGTSDKDVEAMYVKIGEMMAEESKRKANGNYRNLG